MKEKDFQVTAVELTVNLDFRCSYKSKNNGEKLLPRSLVMKLFEATSFSTNFQTSSCGFFVCFCLKSFDEIAFLVL